MRFFVGTLAGIDALHRGITAVIFRVLKDRGSCGDQAGNGRDRRGSGDDHRRDRGCGLPVPVVEALTGRVGASSTPRFSPEP